MTATRPHWHANCHIPGYLPDDNPAFATKKDAQAAMRWHKEAFLDMNADIPEGEEKYRLTGSIRSGLIVVDLPSSLGFSCYIECYPCDDPDCIKEEW